MPLHYPRATGKSKPNGANLSERLRTDTVSGARQALLTVISDPEPETGRWWIGAGLGSGSWPTVGKAGTRPERGSDRAGLAPRIMTNESWGPEFQELLTSRPI